MEKLIILDYSTNTVHIYNISSDLEITDEYVDSLGYNVNNCYYIAGNIDLFKHQGILM